MKLRRFSGASLCSPFSATALRIEQSWERTVANALLEPAFRTLAAPLQIPPPSLDLATFRGSALNCRAGRLPELWAALCSYAGGDLYDHGIAHLPDGDYAFVSSADDGIDEILGAKLAELVIRSTLTGADFTSLMAFAKSLRAQAPTHAIQLFRREAKLRRLPCRLLLGPPTLIVGSGKNTLIFTRTAPGDDSHHGTLISRDKHASKLIFHQLGAPIAESWLVSKDEEIAHLYRISPYPCVVKPLDGSRGAGVFLNIESNEELAKAVRLCQAKTKAPIMVERMARGAPIRLLVCRGEMLIAVKSSPPTVTGDGATTIPALVARENARLRAMTDTGGRNPLLELDEEAWFHLLKTGWTADRIPAKGESVEIRGTAHGGLGGHQTDISSELHPSVARHAIRIAGRLGIALAGVDYISADHTRPADETGGVFLEVNSFPGLRPLELVSTDERSRMVARIFGRAAYPVPTLVIVGADDSGTIRLFESLLKNGTAWYCRGRTGLGRDDPAPRSAVSARDAYPRVVFDPLAEELLFVLDPSDVIEAGLPCEQFHEAYLESDLAGSRIEELLKSCSGRVVTY